MSQRDLALRLIRGSMRNWAKRRRANAHDPFRRYDVEFGAAIGQWSMARSMGVTTELDFVRLSKRIDLIISAPITRLPSRHLKAVAA
jgi:hypothetical protein